MALSGSLAWNIRGSRVRSDQQGREDEPLLLQRLVGLASAEPPQGSPEAPASPSQTSQGGSDSAGRRAGLEMQ